MTTGHSAGRRSEKGRRPHRLAAGILALLASTLAGQATAQAPGAPAASSGPSFNIRGFRITGDNPLGDEAQRILAPFVQSNATIETLQKATSELEGVLRRRGFGLHRVALPPQEITDTVTLNIVRFSIGKVTIEGRNLYDEANIRRSLPELKEDSTPNFRLLAVQTAIANESQGKQVQVALRESETPDKIDATVTVRESKPWSFSVGVNNTGTQASGRDRVTFAGGHSNLFNRDHQFVGAYTTSLQNPSNVKQLGLSYRVPMYEFGGIIGMSYTRSDVVGNFGAFTSTGAGHTFSANYTVYIPPDGGYRSWINFGFDDRVFDVSQINGIPVPGQVDRRSRPVTVGYAARLDTDLTSTGFNLDFSVNTMSGRGNDRASYVTEDPRITTARFKVLRGGANFFGVVAKDWLFGARTLFQYSPDALISGEQFGLGGASTVRGTSERPISGDSGLLVSAEVSTPEIITGLRVLGFLDAGWLNNRNPNGTTKPGSDKVASTGLGLRYVTPVFSAGADYGRIVTGSEVPLAVNQFAPKKGDDKLHINLSVRF